MDLRSGGRSPLVVVVGPTGVGKSALALELAEYLSSVRQIPAEIVSADSRQVYRTLDIGTAKPTADEQRRVRHHAIDLVNPENDFTVAEYQDLAHLAIASILDIGGLPILVGGTGLYVRAVADGLELPRVPPNPALRAELEAIARDHGAERLFDRLVAVDPVAAGRIDARNIRRVVRALEVIAATGRPFSEGSSRRPRYRVLRLGLTMDRDRLYQQIDSRVDRQIAAGIVEETSRALARGCPPNSSSLSGFGYRQMIQYLGGELNLDDAVRVYKFETHRYARQQYGWFRLVDPEIQWMEPAATAIQTAIERVDRFLEPWLDGSQEAIAGS